MGNAINQQNTLLKIGEKLVSAKDGRTYEVVRECSTCYYLAYFDGSESDIITAYKFWDEKEFAKHFVPSYRDYLLLEIKKADWALECCRRALDRYDSKNKKANHE